MALTYNIEDDVRYQQGKEEGKERQAMETIIEMFMDGFTVDKISKYVKQPKEFVEQVIKNIKK